MDDNRRNEMMKVIKAGLSDYLNERQVDFIAPYFIEFPMRLKIVHIKKTYWGLCQYPRKKGERYIITLVRSDMQGHFFMVFLHEIAHMLAHMQFGEEISASHGKEWGSIVKTLMYKAVDGGCFNSAETEILAASVKSYVPLTNAILNTLEQKIIKLYKPDMVRVDSLPMNAIFRLKNGMEMKFIKKLRKYYECVELNSGKRYSVNPDAEVESWRRIE